MLKIITLEAPSPVTPAVAAGLSTQTARETLAHTGLNEILTTRS